jgi:hypothetical protein
MNKLFVLFCTGLFSVNTLSGQVLPVPLVFQEQNQWCWAAVSKSVLDYFGYTVSQCQIADFTRTSATWYDFGTQNCCVAPSGACNHSNYAWGESGSISDILKHFGNIQIIGRTDSLSINEISAELKNARPYIISWGWTTGGGHFLVGHGLDKEMLYYMNPWPGEGFKIALYDWVVSSSEHHWKATIKLRPNPTGINETKETFPIKVYPNPSKGLITIEMNPEAGEQLIEIINLSGQKMYSQTFNIITDNPVIVQTSLPDGLYFLNIKHDRICKSEKLLIIR